MRVERKRYKPITLKLSKANIAHIEHYRRCEAKEAKDEPVSHDIIVNGIAEAFCERRPSLIIEQEELGTLQLRTGIEEQFLKVFEGIVELCQTAGLDKADISKVVDVALARFFERDAKYQDWLKRYGQPEYVFKRLKTKGEEGEEEKVEAKAKTPKASKGKVNGKVNTSTSPVVAAEPVKVDLPVVEPVGLGTVASPAGWEKAA